ncbi:hypothetical protein BASA50_007804 [Batrachochytrium salamandrivorans]|uniref:Uncharacterized protein n=1 Tax=Batrachochytrium salamandrivorans TaxID=1357716 RepID=A0ABQ8F6J6_9FUNG|nr:hypothetical protein BASA61_007842 [Batrachochytrium salamandrivorans]KAH6592838.1 hypothetical protein BASA50_007804 [Batrachochytrium salamandrivorans]
MQFFYLVSLVVVASNVAAFPEPAERFEKHSDSVNADLTSNIEARSYQPEFNPQSNSGNLVSLERRGDSGESSEESSGEDSEFESDSSSATAFDRMLWKIDTPRDRAELGALMLSSMIEQAGDDLVVPKNVKTAGAAVGGGVEHSLVEYLTKALDVSYQLQDWGETSVKEILTVIKSGLGNGEYFNVKSFLKGAGKKLTVDASEYLQQVNAALSAIGENAGSAKQQMEKIHALLGHVFDDYRRHFEVLQLQLDKFDDGTTIHKYLSEADASLVDFTENQQELYDSITQGFEAACLNSDPPTHLNSE